MSYKNVVIMGGGPIGLMAALEAKQYFKNVLIVEKRTDYTRSNVPVLQDDLKKYLSDDLKVGKRLGWNEKNKPTVPFYKLEESLWDQARSKGVKRLSGYVIETLTGVDKKPNGVFKKMTITMKPWDPVAKQIGEGNARAVQADLIVVATGGGAINDPIVQQLGFRWEKLKATNYAAYGIFEHVDDYSSGGSGPVFDEKLRQDIHPTIRDIVPGKTGSGKTGLKTKDHNYLLVTLVGVTKKDFKQLQQDEKRLKLLMTSVGRTINGTVLHQLKPDVDRNVSLFKVKVQKAQQFYSPEYPAVLVGDAAVTPHPETGSGMVTGFKGVQELSKLFEALSRTSRSEDNLSLYLSFDKAFELHVASKALSGTITTLANLFGTVGMFRDDVKKLISNPRFKPIVEEMEGVANRLRDQLDQEIKEAKQLQDLVEGKAVVNLDPRSNVSRLWQRIGVTYNEIQEFTGDLGFLDERLDELENKIKFAV